MKMEMTPEIVAALQLLKNTALEAENEFEAHRIEVLIKDLTDPPKVEVIDDTHQKFNGAVYYKTKDGAYRRGFYSIHRDVWRYYYGEIPEGYEIHHRDLNPANNDISNLQMLTRENHLKVHNKHLRLLKKCPICSKVFRGKTDDTVYCSNKCAAFARSKQVKKICPVCGKVFFGLEKRKYCSKGCAGKVRRKPPIIKKCLFCGKEFEDFSFQGRKFCCLSCSARYHKNFNK